MRMPYPAKPFQKSNNQPRNNVATGPSQPRYVPMDIDVAQLGRPLTPEERKKLLEENRCFYCRDKGHRVARCWKKPNTQQCAPFATLKDTNPFHARAATIKPVESTDTAPPTTSPTAQEQVLSSLKTLSKEEYNNVLNEMMTENFEWA